MEAGWLTLAAGLPLATHHYVANPYETPKVWLLRVLALSMTVAALVRLCEGGLGWGWCRDRAVAWTLGVAAASGVWMLASTLLGLSPWTGLLGTAAREQGALTGLAYLAVFGSLAVFLRGPVRVRRLVSAFLLGSVPVSLLALLEATGVQMLPRPRDPFLLSMPVRATLGQHSFLGAYLLFVIPLAAARAIEASRPEPGPIRRGRQGAPWCLWGAAVLLPWGVVMSGATAGWTRLWWAAVPALSLLPWGVLGISAPRGWARLGYWGLLALQLLALLVSQGRGPWLGFLAALACAVVLGLALWRRGRRLTGAAAAGLGLAVAFLTVLNLPNSPLDPLKRLHPVIQRAGSLWEVVSGSPGETRLRIWRGIPALFVPSADRPAFVTRSRLLIGYGPDGQETVLQAVFPVLSHEVEGRPLSLWVDRAHNDLLDQLITGGVVGLGLVLALWAGLLWGGFRLARSTPGSLLPGALLCALVGHLGELQTGVAITVTRLDFWMIAGVLVALAREARAPTAECGAEPSGGSLRRVLWTQGLLALGGLVAVALLDPASPGGLAGPTAGMTLWVLGGQAVLGAALRPRWVSRSAVPTVVAGVGAAAVAALLVVWEGTRFLAGIHFALGREAVLRNESPRIVLEAYDRAAGLAPRVEFYWQALGEAYYVAALKGALGGDADVRERLLERGARALETARQLNPAFAPPAWSLARLFALRGALGGSVFLEQAEAVFEEAMRLSPRNGPLLAERGDLALARGRLEEAVAWGRRAVAVEPRLWQGHAVLALGASRLGRAEEAREAAAQARGLAPAAVGPRLRAYLGEVR